jgi:hypothetical protein
VGRTVTDVIELSVGLACLLGAAWAWRRRLRAAALVLAAAGAAATVHALASLA